MNARAYTVPHASVPMPSAAVRGVPDWDEPAWRDVPALAVDLPVGSQPSHAPRTLARLCWDELCLRVLFKVEDRYVRAVVDRYQGPIFNAACRITDSADGATDATQTAFVRAFEKLHTFDPRYRFFSWIYRIVVNQSLNIIDRRRDESALEPELAANGGSPETAADDRDRARALERALLDLSPEHRAVVVLKHLHGLSYREIADLSHTWPIEENSRILDWFMRPRATA